MGVAVLLLAAGRGERLGGSLPKAFVPLLGKSLLQRSAEALCAVSAVTAVVPVVAADDFERFDALALSGDGMRGKLQRPVAGGVERQDSVRAGLAALPADSELVAIHDAARCLVAPDDVARVIAAARDAGAAILASPARDTIKQVRGDTIVATPERRECWAAQTPQVFRVELYREALEKADAEGFLGTDDAQLVERLGAEVRVVASTTPNLKITGPEDLLTAEAWLRAQGEGA